ncbi:hypothetical protein NDU88_000905 [Pleurodeles waltl]|uniref:Uncharacterized protein n=1 Tax=Pleurodeles waltl TaxID=8319 RepID=A0AAV7UUG3_PLEWA|nr:hypothetical protein NDU88_000905 [Pleurodeles waltl]
MACSPSREKIRKAEKAMADLRGASDNGTAAGNGRLLHADRPCRSETVSGVTAQSKAAWEDLDTAAVPVIKGGSLPKHAAASSRRGGMHDMLNYNKDDDLEEGELKEAAQEEADWWLGPKYPCHG